MARKPVSFDEPTMIEGDPWIEVTYLDPSKSKCVTRMSLSDLLTWFEDNEGCMIIKMEDIS